MKLNSGLIVFKRKSVMTNRKMSKKAEEQFAQLAEQTARDEFIRDTGLGFAALTPSLIAALSSAAAGINAFMQFQGFWESANTGEKLALIHSEISEALEADRKGLQAEHIQDFSGIEEELADAVIRILDFAGQHGLRLGEAIGAKMQYNLTRPYKHGKAY